MEEQVHVPPQRHHYITLHRCFFLVNENGSKLQMLWSRDFPRCSSAMILANRCICSRQATSILKNGHHVCEHHFRWSLTMYAYMGTGNHLRLEKTGFHLNNSPLVFWVIIAHPLVHLNYGLAIIFILQTAFTATHAAQGDTQLSVSVPEGGTQITSFSYASYYTDSRMPLGLKIFPKIID